MLPWHRNLCAHADLPQHCFDPSDGLPRVNTGNVTGIATSLDHLARHLTEWTDSAPHPLWRKVLLAHGSGNVTTLHVNGATESYQRAPQPRLSPVLEQLSERDVMAAMTVGTSHRTLWLQVASQVAARASLQVAVLGTSRVAGCGGLCARANDVSCFWTSQPFCKAAFSWGRLLHEALSGLLATKVRTHVHAKNAVGPAYFTACTNALVPASADVLVLDLVTRGSGAHVSCDSSCVAYSIEKLRRASHDVF